jgi:hypothetical protein
MGKLKFLDFLKQEKPPIPSFTIPTKFKDQMPFYNGSALTELEEGRDAILGERLLKLYEDCRDNELPILNWDDPNNMLYGLFDYLSPTPEWLIVPYSSLYAICKKEEQFDNVQELKEDSEILKGMEEEADVLSIKINKE